MTSLRPSVVFLALAGIVAGGGCERTESSPAADTSPAPEPEPAAPDVIDADWVASKFQAPPPPAQKDWAREIERDPIAALREMDPAALQKRSARSSAAPTQQRPSARPTHEATYNPEAPLRGWPPGVGQFYPNIVLRDQDGQSVAISDFRGKVVLLELVGLTCKACHAFAGGNEPGRPKFRGITPQPDVPSIERFASGYAKVSLEDPNIVFVQLVLYGMDGRSPPLEKDARAWAQHFDFQTRDGEYVLIGDERFISPQTRALIPGFHLVDQQGILRALSSNIPRHDPLHSSLLPKLAQLLK